MIKGARVVRCASDDFSGDLQDIDNGILEHCRAWDRGFITLYGSEQLIGMNDSDGDSACVMNVDECFCYLTCHLSGARRNRKRKPCSIEFSKYVMASCCECQLHKVRKTAVNKNLGALHGD